MACLVRQHAAKNLYKAQKRDVNHPARRVAGDFPLFA